MKNHRSGFYGLLLWASLLLVMPLTKALAADLLAPQQAIEQASVQLKQNMQDPAFTKDFAKINQFVESVIYPHVDFNRISALVLGKIWKDAPQDERGRFKKEFQTLLVRTYSRAFVEFKDWSVRFLPLKLAADDKKAVVRTEILQPGLQPIAVNYRMVLSNGQWKVYDIMIEGVSLVTNYRTTFQNDFQNKGSLAAIIDGLAARNKEALAGNPSGQS
ncbi:MAG: ABC transporter substrate-binding protein [Methylicorpusculum sp.]|uniref:MlaC/ttg2D family ABC transporter substrate-binding protein n=1 Tax=Methylicorpusculum sp. TaxID=2713644 RepID=UPI0027174770|nr:ABC transporter substrate-binding protein [Methylicorpusculum sp.]MDO8938825.1 ABC transporter substrate-binding protein [Methylicorpusculum sp.]MDO9241420.1 ABC transporter substrate-binding protein [Methylicorpusculum sp.]MDP2180092.1 ABC transporter substrate-binding protein [Methylicorpusculum sp.]MDP2203265.1 ABC transporter substrate-binding protein [Methylicorpusculum sp.]MDP3530644.1 ABC transporter substrate-binding protein [Methylicorpusculum sp.]